MANRSLRQAWLDRDSSNLFDLDSLDAEAAEIDENIARANLKALDLSMAIARRKEIYETKYPETKRGGDRKSKRKNSVLIPPFARALGAMIGKDKSSVGLYAKVGNALEAKKVLQIRED